MARHGENVRKRKDGRWEGRYKVYSVKGGKDVYRSIYGRSYEDVKKRLIAIKNNIEKTDRLDLDFKTVVEAWLEEIKRKRKHSTWVKYRTVYEKYLLHSIGDYQIVEITSALVREEILENLSDSIYKSIYSVINQTLSFAQENYCISTHSVRQLKRKGKRKRLEILDRKEQEKLIAVLCTEMDLYKMAVLLRLLA